MTLGAELSELFDRKPHQKQISLYVATRAVANANSGHVTPPPTSHVSSQQQMNCSSAVSE